MSITELIVDLLKQDLSAPRVMLEQVVNYLHDRFEAPSAELEDFFAKKFSKLEDYEVDLAFSPQYTPGWQERLAFIPILGPHHLTADQVAQVKQQLVDAQLITRFKAPDSGVEVSAPVHEVFIERYVNLLKLDQPLAEAVYQTILTQVPEASHNEVNLLAREEVWQSEIRQQTLMAFLKTFHARHSFSTQKVSYLTNFMRTYRPGSLLDLERQFDSLIDSCRKDMENVAGRGFHDEYLKALNTGNSLTKGSEHDIWDHYRQMMDHAEQLKLDYQQLPEFAPEIWQQASLQKAI